MPTTYDFKRDSRKSSTSAESHLSTSSSQILNFTAKPQRSLVMSAPKISVYSLSDLKNTTDDALPNYLTSLKFQQSHFLADVRLALGYSAVVIAGVTFYADYKLGWDATKFWTLWAVVVYFILNGALTYWIWGVEKGKIFTGEINDTLVSIASSVKKHKPIYNLQVCYGKPGEEPRVLKIAAPFTRWFDADGYFVATPFQQWLATEIPPIGEADPKKVVGGGGGGKTEEKVIEARQVKGNADSDKMTREGGARSRNLKKAT